MEEHKSEIADWDLGAGIYIDFYVLKSSLQEEDITDEPVSNSILCQNNIALEYLWSLSHRVSSVKLLNQEKKIMQISRSYYSFDKTWLKKIQITTCIRFDDTCCP